MAIIDTDPNDDFVGPFTQNQELDFDFSFFIGSDQIRVEYWKIANTLSGRPEQLTFVQGVDYTIDENNKKIIVTNDMNDDGDYRILVYRESALKQESSFANGAFPAESVEEQFDKVVLQVQEVDERLSRALVVGPYDDPIDQADIDALLLLPPRVDAAEDDIDTLEAWRLEDELKIDQAVDTDIPNLQTRMVAVEAAIPLLDPPITHITAAGAHAPVFGETVIVDTTGGVTITLPAPQNAKPKIVVKFTENIDNKIVTSAADIDGSPDDIEPVASYESLTFVCTATKWYIV
jgi:hypothetical protein